eukprot:2151942-Rhodomonas_salina.1
MAQRTPHGGAPLFSSRGSHTAATPRPPHAPALGAPPIPTTAAHPTTRPVAPYLMSAPHVRVVPDVSPARGSTIPYVSTGHRLGFTCTRLCQYGASRSMLSEGSVFSIVTLLGDVSTAFRVKA